MTLRIAHVRPAKRWNGIDLAEIWEYRDVLDALIRRDLKVRYQQTIAGVLWVLGQPILTTIVLSLVLTRLAGQTQEGIPYPLFVYAALVPWGYASHALTKATNCFVEHAQIVTRVYLPRLLLPLAAILAALADFGIAFLFLPALLIYYRVPLTLAIIALPVVLALMVVTVFGIGLWLATFNAQFRDFAFALPFLLQFGLFITPVFYSSQIVPLPWRAIYALNPMVGVIEGLRWSLLGSGSAPPWTTFAFSVAGALTIVASGLYFFQLRDPELADVI